MDPLQVTFLFVAGLLTGAFNAVAGGGSLIGFSALLGVGIPPLTAKMTSTVAVFPGNVASVAGGFRDLPDRRAVLRLLPAAVLGGAVGSILLLLTPSQVFDMIVPFLILAASFILGLQNTLKEMVTRSAVRHRRHHPAILQALVAVGSVYAGYIGAGFGIVLVAILAFFQHEPLTRTVALKNLLSAVIASISVALYVLFGTIHWTSATILFPATVIGGYGGARLLRRLPDKPLRAAIVTFGTAFGLVLLWVNVL
ncbi:sulfite exporter TauE/SafE family protein [Micromonospora sp. KC721]|uniref:sulfite exporter TauE/SafE family protein n=1 Tax=Micromonospora sp. KC721 TaxID=2530380 RepID=UPI001049E414|nr:sulfite exporter TauE/SafE family protein [Micromonospora sp. KC721]TDB70485.1 sulfite exporter TauE/SafE family protein [Micromonospora sp. KC721]